MSSILFSRKLRIIKFLDGIESRLDRLFIDYTGGLVELKPKDVVIDCGANIGEFSIYCSNLGADVFAFEPDPLEFKVLQANSKGRFSVSQAALWKDSAGIRFYSANETADSSAFPREIATSILNVPTTTLDILVSEIAETKSNGFRIKLLKLEAEGAEPEIIAGALHVLDHIMFIAADLGPERGDKCENTVAQVVNLLIKRGFEIRYFMPDRCIFLFENKRVLV